MITGAHAIIYSTNAGADRAFLRDVLRFTHVDVGDGWLIFDLAEADLGVHPADHDGPPSGTADVSFYCDDIETTVRDLKERGVEFTHPIEDHGYGLVTFFNAPGDFSIQLFQPKYMK